VAVFVALTFGGLAVLLTVGDPGGGSVQLATPQTLPEGYEDGPGTTATAAPASDDPTTTTTTTTTTQPVRDVGTSVTFPDGSPAPTGADEVVVREGVTSVRFSPPAGLTEAELDNHVAVVPATSVSRGEQDRVLDIRLTCDGSADEFLSQLTVTEGGSVVTVEAVVLVPPDGPPCASGSATSLRVPLSAPVGDRSISVVPAGVAIVEPRRG
jgi:hypothetical protein